MWLSVVAWSMHHEHKLLNARSKRGRFITPDVFAEVEQID